MNLRHQLILKILSSGGSMNRQEIFEALEPSEQGLFLGGVNGVSRDLDVLKNKKQFIENGANDYINGKSVFTWMLTGEGKRALLLLDQPKAQANEPQPAEKQPIIDEPPQHTPLFELGYPPDDSLSIAKDYAALAQKYAQAATETVQRIINNAQIKTVNTPTVKNKAATIAALRNRAEFIIQHEALNHAADILEMLEEDPQ